MLDEVKFGKQKDETKVKGSSFISAFAEPLAGLVALPQHCALSDVNNNGEYKLIIGHLGDGKSGFRLKVYSQTSLIQSPALLALPAAVISFNISNGIKALAVAAGNFVFIYKNLKPYFKYTLPDLDLSQIEKEAWIQAREDKTDPAELRAILIQLNDQLSQRSAAFIRTKPGSEEELSFVEKYKSQPLTKHTSIVAMGAMNRSIDDENGLSVLLIGTENKELLIVDVEAFTILRKVKLSSVPVFISSFGLFDVEYHITVVCRDGHGYHFTRDTDMVDLFTMETHSVGLIQKGRFLYTANTDGKFTQYTMKGSIGFIRKTAASPVCMELLSIRSKGLSLIAIALANNTVEIWNESERVETLTTSDQVIAMRFGRYNREDATLAVIYATGGLEIFIVRRKATFERRDDESKSVQVESIKMPKMSQSYLEQVNYERDNSQAIFQRLQYDLSQIKLRAAKEMIKIENKSLAPISTKESIAMSVALTGIGPTFKLRVTVTNTARDIHVLDEYNIFYLFDRTLYKVEQRHTRLPLLVPDQPQHCDCFIRALSNVTGQIRVSIAKNNNPKPIASTIINMPPAEVLQL